jgi:hypothetical protein
MREADVENATRALIVSEKRHFPTLPGSPESVRESGGAK